MEKDKITVQLVKQNNAFINKDKYDIDASIHLSGIFAGECYDKEGFNHILLEDPEKTKKRVERTINNCHHSVYSHNNITFNIENVPKIVAMVLNNEHEYNTSEKSARYTQVVKGESDKITDKEVELYSKWVEIFKIKIKDRYKDQFSDFKIRTLAQENARYLVTIFMPTKMVYTTSLRQINYIVSWLKKYISEHDKNNLFEERLSKEFGSLIEELEKTNVLTEPLLRNEKNRGLSLFTKDVNERVEYYGDVFLTKYKGTFAQLAQSMRHRTLDYEFSFLDNEEFFVPPIIEDDEALVKEWINDIKSVSSVYPQGLLVNIVENGKYENFILKCQERLCSAAQLEIMRQTRETLMKYKEELEKTNHPRAKDIVKYTKGARCTFPHYKCSEPCNFKEGIQLKRKI